MSAINNILKPSNSIKQQLLLQALNRQSHLIETQESLFSNENISLCSLHSQISSKNLQNLNQSKTNQSVEQVDFQQLTFRQQQPKKKVPNSSETSQGSQKLLESICTPVRQRGKKVSSSNVDQDFVNQFFWNLNKKLGNKEKVNSFLQNQLEQVTNIVKSSQFSQAKSVQTLRLYQESVKQLKFLHDSSRKNPSNSLINTVKTICLLENQCQLSESVILKQLKLDNQIEQVHTRLNQAMSSITLRHINTLIRLNAPNKDQISLARALMYLFSQKYQLSEVKAQNNFRFWKTFKDFAHKPGQLLKQIKKLPDWIDQNLISLQALKLCVNAISNVNENSLIGNCEASYSIFTFLKTCCQYCDINKEKRISSKGSKKRVYTPVRFSKKQNLNLSTDSNDIKIKQSINPDPWEIDEVEQFSSINISSNENQWDNLQVDLFGEIDKILEADNTPKFSEGKGTFNSPSLVDFTENDYFIGIKPMINPLFVENVNQYLDSTDNSIEEEIVAKKDQFQYKPRTSQTILRYYHMLQNGSSLNSSQSSDAQSNLEISRASSIIVIPTVEYSVTDYSEMKMKILQERCNLEKLLERYNY